jgi:hypothetical protein
MVTGTGRIRVISTSKIRKITAIRKKRRENGKRLGLLGSNPHSKGDGFSRSWIAFLQMAELVRIRVIANLRDNPKMMDTKVAIGRWAIWLEARHTLYITTLS